MSVFRYREVAAPVRPHVGEALEYVAREVSRDLGIDRKSFRIAWFVPDPDSDKWIDHPANPFYQGFALLDGTILLARHGTDEIWGLACTICEIIPHELWHHHEHQHGMAPSEEDAKRYARAVSGPLWKAVYEILFEKRG